jgi:hypothetical protein
MMQQGQKLSFKQRKREVQCAVNLADKLKIFQNDGPEQVGPKNALPEQTTRIVCPPYCLREPLPRLP